ncbi:acyltransferase family protein [Pengzhenrongella sicca]|uniref:Acyltransferase n=1 Tax=Pengzhenrongella sicca TaxID=2819238 RepID=A0A8A4ZAM5_9MICO|nr:acyltransferase family protein [Pengzhenrongella sicca]QTE28924.1 acyltransferase [Pengzhenrongella sicca]
MSLESQLRKRLLPRAGSGSAAAAAPPTRPGSGGFRPDIEGLRAVAVALVVLYHARLPGLTGGYVGVDVFFVISGFLITSHLSAELTRTGRVAFGRFYARRMRRILPASFVVLAATVVAAVVVMPPLRVPSMVKDAIATALYFPNVRFARQGTDYLAGDTPSPLQHYWSLGVEEQFYLLWPLLLVIVTLLVRRSQRRLVAALGLIVAGSFALNLVVMQFSTVWAFFLLPTRAWELGVGGLVALAIPWLRRRRVSRAPILGVVGLALVIGSAIAFDDTTTFPGFAAAVPVIGCALALAGGTQNDGIAGRMLRTAPFQSLGRLSYSVYLWHWPLLILVESRLAGPLPLAGSLALAVLALPLAALTYRYVEDPVRHLPLLTAAPAARTLLAGLAGSLVIVILAMGLGRWSAGQPLATATPAPSTGLTAPPAFTPVVPTNMRPSLRGVAADQPIAYADRCQLESTASALRDCPYGDVTSDRVVALFGDSHATQWLPALDSLGKAQGFRVQLYAKSGCPSAEVAQTRAEDDNCVTYRRLALAAIEADPPELVILSNAGQQFWADSSTAAAQWRAGLAATLEALPPSSAQLIIGTTPSFAVGAPTCLSIHLADAGVCGAARDLVVDPERLDDEQSIAAAHGAGYFPAVDYLCTTDRCETIEGDILLYRDEHHLTTVASVDLADELDALLFSGATS